MGSAFLASDTAPGCALIKIGTEIPVTDGPGILHTERNYYDRTSRSDIDRPWGRENWLDVLFCRAAGEGIRVPDDVVDLLNDEGVQTGSLTGRNPITHDQWWIPIATLAAAGAPYAKALGSVILTWLKERNWDRSGWRVEDRELSPIQQMTPCICLAARNQAREATGGPANHQRRGSLQQGKLAPSGQSREENRTDIHYVIQKRYRARPRCAR